MERKKTLPVIGFMLYMLLLIWLVIFKLEPNPLNISTTGRSLNLIPFAGSAIVNGRISADELLYNFLVFVPLGLYLSILRLPKKPFLRIAAGFSISLAFETVQYVFKIGASDITDLIMNTAGVAVGVLAFEAVISKAKEKTIGVIAFTLLLLEMLALAGYVLIMVMQ